MLKFEDVNTKVFSYFSVDITRDDCEYLGFICMPSIASRKYKFFESINKNLTKQEKREIKAHISTLTL